MIPKWLWINATAGRLDHLRKINHGYVADSYFLDVDWFVNFKFIVDMRGYEITLNGDSKYHPTCIEIKITKKEEFKK
jgi:hypothetical protein